MTKELAQHRRLGTPNCALQAKIKNELSQNWHLSKSGGATVMHLGRYAVAIIDSS